MQLVAGNDFMASVREKDKRTGVSSVEFQGDRRNGIRKIKFFLRMIYTRDYEYVTYFNLI